ncbi:hypothetical protein N7489_005717 [Penicillium chrysogenum]|uniref:uncharacterized protein n=1 Tax=Penicillium chrysogenum TaxID=5076 RepID=UPI0024DF29BC|nr:uncharacterized protein N7489_005717 [Penicillium chrysogenum]KAJ5245621.1 hypothetical protein N7489_005717 [Penicillium chrysogenum]
MGPEGFLLDFANAVAVIDSCDRCTFPIALYAKAEADHIDRHRPRRRAVNMVDACFTPVHAYNTTTSPVTTTRRARIGYLKELKHCN